MDKEQTKHMSCGSSDNGRAYEFICLISLQDAISAIRPSQVIYNSGYEAALKAWNTLSEDEKTLYTLNAKSTVETIFALGPGIVEQTDDILQLHIQIDKRGVEADVHDIIIERKDIVWEIGQDLKHRTLLSTVFDNENRGTFGEVYNTYDHRNKRNVCNIMLDSEFEWVEYRGVGYPIRTANFWNMNVRVATKSFDEALYDKETGLPTSKEAEAIDETLFYFVQDEEIFLPQHKLLQLLEKQVA